MKICAKLLCAKKPKKKCVGTMRAAEKKQSKDVSMRPSLKSFYGLIWPNVVVEDSEELYWVRNIKLRTSLASPVGTGL